MIIKSLTIAEFDCRIVKQVTDFQLIFHCVYTILCCKSAIVIFLINRIKTNLTACVVRIFCRVDIVNFSAVGIINNLCCLEVFIDRLQGDCTPYCYTTVLCHRRYSFGICSLKLETLSGIIYFSGGIVLDAPAGEVLTGWRLRNRSGDNNTCMVSIVITIQHLKCLFIMVRFVKRTCSGIVLDKKRFKMFPVHTQKYISLNLFAKIIGFFFTC